MNLLQKTQKKNRIFQIITVPRLGARLLFAAFYVYA